MAIILDKGRNIKRLTLIQTVDSSVTVLHPQELFKSYTDSVLRQCSKGAM